MPTVVDAAHVTTKDSAVWRTCTGCSRLAPLAPGVDRCAGCDQPATADDFAARHASSGWKYAHRYAGALGRIEAWAVLIPDLTDAERLTKIREALTELDEAIRAGGQQ